MRILGQVSGVTAFALFLALAASAQTFENVPEAKPQSTAPAAAPGLKIGILNVQLAMFRTQERTEDEAVVREAFREQRDAGGKVAVVVGDQDAHRGRCAMSGALAPLHGAHGAMSGAPRPLHRAA